MPIGCLLWIILIVVFGINMYGWVPVIFTLAAIIIGSFLEIRHRDKMRKRRRNNINKK